MTLFTNLLTGFVLGLFTPLTAVSILPLYLIFLSFFSSKVKSSEKRTRLLHFGMMISFGVIISMLFLGAIFVSFLIYFPQSFIDGIAPWSFVVLLFISVLLLLNINATDLFPTFKIPHFKSQNLNGLIYGLFFGTLIIPSNPLLIFALLAKSVTITLFWESILLFLFFGIGISFLLLFLASISLPELRDLINFFVSHLKTINKVVGFTSFIIAIYYLVFVFRILT